MVIVADISSIEKPDTFGVVNSTRQLVSANSEIVTLALVNDSAPILPLPIETCVMFSSEPSPVDNESSRSQIEDRNFNGIFDEALRGPFMIRAQNCLRRDSHAQLGESTFSL